MEEVNLEVEYGQMIKWIRTSRLSTENSLSLDLEVEHGDDLAVLHRRQPHPPEDPCFRVWGLGFRFRV